LLPDVIESLCEISATTACGRIPKIAIGRAATTVRISPCTDAGMNSPHIVGARYATAVPAINVKEIS